jgi:hypothetical protein
MMEKFPAVVEEEERQKVLSYLEERFGIPPETFEFYSILKGVSNYWLFPKTELLPKLRFFQIQTVGLLFLRKVSKYLKPTSVFLQRFGYLASKSIITLTQEELSLLKEKGKLFKEFPIEPGYVILKDRDWILGCGLYVNGKLISHLEPKVIKTL